MDRTPAIPPSQLSDEAKPIYDTANEIFTQSYGESGEQFIWKNEDGGLIGPLAPVIYTPGTLLPAIQLSGAIAAAGPLTAQQQELAIFATAVHIQTDYVLYAHRILGRAQGLSDQQLHAIEANERPQGLNDASYFILDALHESFANRYRLSDKTWQRGVELLGRAGLVQLLQVSGFYTYLGVFMNGAKVPRPDQCS